MKSDDNMMFLPPVFVGAEADALLHAGEINWGMSAFGVSALREASADAPPIKIGLIDDGCDYTHPLLSGVVKGYRSFVGRDVRTGDHGTHCGGTIAAIDPNIGVNQRVELYIAQGLDPVSGSGSMTALMAGMEWCLSNGCEILSCSWGGGALTAADDRRFREWAESALRPWMVFAGGNSGPNTPDADSPGRSMHLFNVAALNPNFTPASFSSAGDKLDTSGPGVNIWSLRPGGGYSQKSGTSMATPFVAGAVGHFRAGIRKAGRPMPSVYDLRTIAVSRSTDTHTPGDDRRTGPGWLTPELLRLYLTPDAPVPTP